MKDSRADDGPESLTSQDAGGSTKGTFTVPPERVPGLLLVHGWDSSQAHYQARAEDFAALGFVCLTFDLQGHGGDQDRSDAVTREDNLKDVLEAYDLLAAHPHVDAESIAVIGTSYGGYLAALATALRPVRWLALRVPALYPDAHWTVPKARLDRDELMAYRKHVHAPGDNRVLTACGRFEGDVLIVGSGADEKVPPPTIASYVQAFRTARSMTHRSIPDADHELSDERMLRTYDSLLHSWITEMLLGARTHIGG